MTQRTLGLIMNGVSGRMGVNQHLIRSVAAIRAQGGVAMSDGSRVMLDPVLVSRTGAKVKRAAQVCLRVGDSVHRLRRRYTAIALATRIAARGPAWRPC